MIYLSISVVSSLCDILAIDDRWVKSKRSVATKADVKQFICIDCNSNKIPLSLDSAALSL